MNKAAIEGLRGMPGNDFGPDPVLRHLDVVSGYGFSLVIGRGAEQEWQLLRGYLGYRLLGFPVEVRVVNEGRELVYPLAQTFIGTQLPHQRHHVPEHQEAIAVAGVVPGLLQRPPDFREDLLR
jgi:hypothetical protein